MAEVYKKALEKEAIMQGTMPGKLDEGIKFQLNNKYKEKGEEETDALFKTNELIKEGKI